MGCKGENGIFIIDAVAASTYDNNVTFSLSLGQQRQAPSE